jgi:hypothetical protein
MQEEFKLKKDMQFVEAQKSRYYFILIRNRDFANTIRQITCYSVTFP